MSSRPRGPLSLSGGEAFPAVTVTRPGSWVFRPRAARPITIEVGIGMWCSSSRWQLVTLHRRPTAGVVPVGEPELVDGGVIVRVDYRPGQIIERAELALALFRPPAMRISSTSTDDVPAVDVGRGAEPRQRAVVGVES